MSINPNDLNAYGSLSQTRQAIPGGHQNQVEKRAEKESDSSQSFGSDAVTIDGSRQTGKRFDADSIKERKTTEEAPKESSTKSSEGTTTITLISTNDLHAQLKNMSKVSGLVHQLKTENPNALVLDVGDIAYNPPYSDANHFDPMVDIMNQIGYNVVEPGNHEFQYGSKTMHDEYTSRINADVVCSNIRDPKTNDLLEGTKPYVIKDVNGVKVAFIGTVVPHMETSAHPDVGKDVKKLDINDTVNKLIPEVKAQGAEVIVTMSHHGVGKNADADLAQSVQGIDVILSGHDHQLTESPMVFSKFPNKTYLIEGMSHGKYVMKTDIVVDNKTHDVIAVNMKPYPTSSSTVKADPAVDNIIQNYQDKGGGAQQNHGGGNVNQHNNGENNHHGKKGRH